MVDLKKNTCSCEFFRNHEICSHILAAEELFPERIKVRNVF
ncbi:MAG: SWIM zinc finger family protein [Candidatus Pacebacteria bacterium]|nr:SWIM zinc finger family protein [Candidatus Paceibacterota bacterium]